MSEKAFLSDADIWKQIEYAKPEKVILALGGNNMEPLSTYLSNVLTPLISKLRGLGVQDILWIGPFRADPQRAPQTADRHSSTNEALRDFTAQNNVKYVDVYDLTDLSGSRDGVHLTPTAYRSVVDRIQSDILLWASGVSGGALLLGVPRVYVYAGAGVLTTLLFALLLRRRSRRRR